MNLIYILAFVAPLLSPIRAEIQTPTPMLTPAFPA